MRSLLRVCAVWMLVAGGRALAAPADFQAFLDWWPGNYDNQRQAESEINLPSAERHTPTRLFIRRIDAPAFGPHAFYAEWQDAAPPHKVTRQRIYAFRIDPETGNFRLALHIFPNDRPELVAHTSGAYQDPGKLAGLIPADRAGVKGCDVLFAYSENAFTGAMTKGECAYPAPDGTPIYSWSQMKLTPDAFSYLDGWYRMDGTPYRKMGELWYVFDKRPLGAR